MQTSTQVVRLMSSAVAWVHGRNPSSVFYVLYRHGHGCTAWWCFRRRALSWSVIAMSRREGSRQRGDSVLPGGSLRAKLTSVEGVDAERWCPRDDHGLGNSHVEQTGSEDDATRFLAVPGSPRTYSGLPNWRKVVEKSRAPLPLIAEMPLAPRTWTITCLPRLLMTSPDFPGFIAELGTTSDCIFPTRLLHDWDMEPLSLDVQPYAGSTSDHNSESRVPSRPKKTRNRTTTACNVCRARRTKCNSQRPACGYCHAHGLDCEYEQPARSGYACHF